ncbi:uncharacterized protein LOC127833283 [Dreissena polymorpha]|uniref:Uncharacterized protein n=1 Tax=Dreissena polymorpha TaxID=45954 RepID=A0A9D4G931_DREPO|nr:uncharacterized protein LOC127833283 [Dreissena polymorpha]KAH3811061.1 hypothetical protein DPMN_139463 [Dreissena polymorpha]
MQFPDNEDRPMRSGHDTDDRKHEDVISYKRDRSIDGREEDRPVGCFDIKSNDLSFDQDCLAREGNDRHVHELNLQIDRDDNVRDNYNNRLNDRKSNKSHLDERNSLHDKINTNSSNSSYGSRQSFKENLDMHQSHDRDFSIIRHSNFGDHESNRMYGERKNNESQSTLYDDRTKSYERDEINSRLFHERCFPIYRHGEVSDDEGIRYFEKSGKRGSSHGSNYDFRGGNNGRKYNTERVFKRARHEHIRVDERGHENLLHVRVDDEDMFLPRRSPLNPVKDYSLNGHSGRNDAVKHETYISKWDAEKYEARRHIKEDSQRERREDFRSFDNHYFSSRLSGYDQVRDPHVEVRDPHVEHVTHMLTANEEGRGCDNMRFDDRNHLPDAYLNSSDAVPLDHMKNSVNGFGEGNSSSRDLYTEIRDQLSVEELQRGQTGDPFNDRVFLSNVQRKIHDEELKIHTELRDFYTDTELEGNRSTQSCLIDETSSGNHCPAELLQTQGGSHASRKRKRDFDSKIVKNTNRKRKSRSEIRKGIRTNENDRRSPAGNDDQRFITEEKTFVQKMFKDTGIKFIDDGIEIPK